MQELAVCTGFEPVLCSVTGNRGLLTPLTDRGSAYENRTRDFALRERWLSTCLMRREWGDAEIRTPHT